MKLGNLSTFRPRIDGWFLRKKVKPYVKKTSSKISNKQTTKHNKQMTKTNFFNLPTYIQ